LISSRQPVSQKENMNRQLLAKLLSIALFVVWVLAVSGSQRNKPQPEKQKMTEPTAAVRFINRAPAGYSHIVEARGGRTLYIAGQLALDVEGKLVGAGDFRAQIKQVFANLNTRLQEAGASFKDVVKLNYYLTDGSDLQPLREVRDSYVNKEAPPASTLVVVKQLVRPEYLCEVEAIAVVND
jgi:enamine deaminase RidA (YjgF/YER057c/UK114 family)